MGLGGLKSSYTKNGYIKKFSWQRKILVFIFCCGCGVSITTIRDVTKVDYKRIKDYLDGNNGPVAQKIIERFDEFIMEGTGKEEKDKCKHHKKSLYYISKDNVNAYKESQMVMHEMTMTKEEDIKKLYTKFKKLMSDDVKDRIAFINGIKK